MHFIYIKLCVMVGHGLELGVALVRCGVKRNSIMLHSQANLAQPNLTEGIPSSGRPIIVSGPGPWRPLG